MKIVLRFILLLLCSCSTLHTIPDHQSDRHAFEYCGGELWGYIVPLGPRETMGFWSRQNDDPKPKMAVFLHMHSILEKDPEHSLTLHVVIRTRENLAIQIQQHAVAVQLAARNETEIPTEWVINEEAMEIEQLYPNQLYESQLVDQKSNQWKIAKRNPLAPFLSGTPEFVTLPPSLFKTLTIQPEIVDFDAKKYSQVFVSSATQIWPAHQPLSDTTIVVRLPSFVLNGTTYESQTFAFNTNYENVKRVRSSYGRCPSTEEIFRFNN